MRRVTTICAAFGSVLTAVWIIAASFMVVLAPPVTHNLANAFVDTEHSTLSHDYLVQTACDVRAYCMGDDSVQLPQGTDDDTQMTPDIMQHLNDVRAVFVGAQVAFWILTVAEAAFMVCTVFVRRRVKSQGGPVRKRARLRRLGNILLGGGIIALAATTVVALIGIFNFNALFTGMHDIFFPQGNWTFSAYSLLICSLPDAFWMGCGVVWAVALVALSVIAVLIGAVLKRCTKAQSDI